jgi:four helix bundle protein
MDNQKSEGLVYQKAFDLAMKIFKVSRLSPREEKYSLTDQLRRSSRSFAASISIAYNKRPYDTHIFIDKISEADIHIGETLVWLEFALSCRYISNKTFSGLCDQCRELGELLQEETQNPEP